MIAGYGQSRGRGHDGAVIVIGLLMPLSFMLQLQIWMQITVQMLLLLNITLSMSTNTDANRRNNHDIYILTNHVGTVYRLLGLFVLSSSEYMGAQPLGVPPRIVLGGGKARSWGSLGAKTSLFICSMPL